MNAGLRREEVHAIKRERILREAVTLFYEHGFTGATLDDVAARLGVTKPVIYSYFGSKMELLEAICRPTIELSFQAVAEAAAGAGSATERLYRAMVDFARVVLGRQADIAIFFREEKSLDPAALARIDALRKEYDRVCRGCLPRGWRTVNFRLRMKISRRLRSGVWSPGRTRGIDRRGGFRSMRRPSGWRNLHCRWSGRGTFTRRAETRRLSRAGRSHAIPGCIELLGQVTGRCVAV